MTAHALADIRERCLKPKACRTTSPSRSTRNSCTPRWRAGWARRCRRAAGAAAQRRWRRARCLPALNGIDTARGLRHVAGNSALYMQLLDRFRHSQRDTPAELRAELAGGNMAAAGKRPHAARRGRQHRRHWGRSGLRRRWKARWRAAIP
jgi:two-component system sensor histidine kinase/response regulator